SWAARRKKTFSPGRGDYYQLTVSISNREVILLKPTSFMNLSGIPILKVVQQRRLSPENLLILCDDVALPFGTIRIRKAGSDGGQRGLASVISELETENVPRMRIGIYTENRFDELSDYVLSPIPDDLYKDLKRVVKTSTEALDCILHNGLSFTMNRYNRNVLDDNSQIDNYTQD
ncbi:MAG: aminoacyl-tRNA hydrolase, partial [bacterium]